MKNRKKKLRKIVVNGTEYKWYSSYNGDGDGGLELAVFKGKTRLQIPYVTPGPSECTPKYVRERILDFINDTPDSKLHLPHVIQTSEETWHSFHSVRNEN